MAPVSQSTASNRQTTFVEIPLVSRPPRADTQASSEIGSARGCAGCVERKCLSKSTA
ncbi:hypothetical protein J3D46_004896 [Paenarthrobacter sp. A20]|nr:hypothetical protein [Paenarthrobacter sp. A20]